MVNILIYRNNKYECRIDTIQKALYGKNFLLNKII